MSENQMGVYSLAYLQFGFLDIQKEMKYLHCNHILRVLSNDVPDRFYVDKAHFKRIGG